MISSNSAKLVFLAAIIALSASCNFWQSNSPAPANAEISGEGIESWIPFPSKEPEVFSAEIILSDDESEERKIAIARHENRLRLDYEGGLSSLRLEEGNFLISAPQRIYAENKSEWEAAEESGESLEGIIGANWLNQKAGAEFQKIESGEGISKYKAVFEASEAIIFFDEALKMPLRQELYSIDGDQRIMLYAVEMKNFSPSAEEKKFEVPGDYRKVSLSEFREATWRKK